MSVETIIRKAIELDITLTAVGDKIRYRPASVAPPDVVEKLRQHKPEVLEHLRRHEAPMPKGRVCQVYPGDGPDTHELEEMTRRVEAEGYVLCKVNLLEDFVAFHRDDVDPATIPPGFVRYSATELMHLFSEDKADFSVEDLRHIHEAKRPGARVTENRPRSTRDE